MSKVAVVYWSGTGNTQAMAELVAQGAREAGAQVDVFTSADFSADQMDHYEAVAFGCPSMGVEVLEETEFEPMFTECEGKLKDKKIALFGSYDWGDGEWMRNWADNCAGNGAVFVADSVICHESPEGTDIQSKCKALGKALA